MPFCLPQCGRPPARCAFGTQASAGCTATSGGGGREWSKTRLGFAVFEGLRAWMVQKASGFDGFGRIRADSVRLRRILDHMPAKPLFPPETQTHFGPPNRWSTRPQDRQAAGPREARHPRINGRPAICGTPAPKNTKILVSRRRYHPRRGQGRACSRGSLLRMGAAPAARALEQFLKHTDTGVDAFCNRRGVAGRRGGRR